jgi:hypothetical protein
MPQLNFGPQLETALIGSLFTGNTGSVVILQSAGSTDLTVRVAVNNSLTPFPDSKSAFVVDAFGVESFVHTPMRPSQTFDIRMLSKSPMQFRHPLVFC